MSATAVSELTDRDVELENVGPVESVRFTLPEGGGLIVLQGDNGAGLREMGGNLRLNGDFRFVVDHPKRGECYFADLSAGEKWSQVLPIAIKAVGTGGVFVVPQEAYEGLSPRNRNLLLSHLRGSGVTAVTAEAADGQLRAVVRE